MIRLFAVTQCMTPRYERQRLSLPEINSLYYTDSLSFFFDRKYEQAFLSRSRNFIAETLVTSR